MKGRNVLATENVPVQFSVVSQIPACSSLFCYLLLCIVFECEFRICVAVRLYHRRLEPVQSFSILCRRFLDVTFTRQYGNAVITEVLIPDYCFRTV